MVPFRERSRAPLGVILATLVLLFALSAVSHADIIYIYDRLGRLVGVVDPAGDTAVYHYDAVGNLTSISRQSSAVVSLIDFNPASGPVGTTVTIYGTGFSPTPSQNTVTFNGAAATVSSASATELVVTVPAGATTGSIGVTAPAGSASSGVPFTVMSTSGAPTITGFTPAIGTPGTAVSITGTNFELTPTNNRLRFHITAGAVTSSTGTTMSVPVPVGATSGRLSLATPGGATQSADDFFVPPPPATAASVSFTARATIGGPTINASIASVGKIALIVFDGIAGQPVSLGIGSGGVVETDTYVYNPNGSQLAWVYSDFLGRDLHVAALPVTGTYTIQVGPRGTYTGTKGITLSQDLIVGPIAVGGASVPVNITRPGQRARLTFSGTAGQRLTLGFPGATIFDAVTVTKPDGTTLAGFTGTGDYSIVMPPLPTTGTYTILIDPRYADTRSMTLTLSEELSGVLVIDGSSLTLPLSRIGQVARVTFAGTAGQRLNMAVTNANISTTMTSFKPDGTAWGTSTVSNNTVTDYPLPTTGTYTLVFDPSGSTTGTMTLWLSTEVGGSIAMGGPPVAVSLTRPGQKARLTYSGTASQRVSLNITGITTSGSVSASLIKPDGTLLSSPPGPFSKGTYFGPGSGFLGAFTLPTTETAYAVLLTPESAGTAGATFTLYNVPPDVTGTTTINGGPVPVTITVPGQNVAAITFPGTAGPVVTVRGDSNTIGCGNFGVILPNGSTPNSSPCSVTFSMQITLQNGTHTIFFNPTGANTGSVNLSVTQP